MPQFRVFITMAATSRTQAIADIDRMTKADTNKSVQTLWIEEHFS